MRRLLLLGLSAILFVAGCAKPGTTVRRIRVRAAAAPRRRPRTTPTSISPNLAGSDAIVTGSPVVRATISLADQQRIITAVRDEATIRFTAHKEDVIVDDHGCSAVRDHGMLVALTEPVRLPEQTKLALSAFVACAGAEGVAYQLHHDGDSWTIMDSTTLWVS
jgi:hypothetical protein